VATGRCGATEKGGDPEGASLINGLEEEAGILTVSCGLQFMW